jgi:hypothetical protein
LLQKKNEIKVKKRRRLMDPFPSEEIRLAFIAFFPHPPVPSVHLFTQVERLPQFSIALRRVDGNLQFVEPQDPRFLFTFFYRAPTSKRTLSERRTARARQAPHRQKNRIQTTPLLSTWSD